MNKTESLSTASPLQNLLSSADCLILSVLEHGVVHCGQPLFASPVELSITEADWKRLINPSIAHALFGPWHSVEQTSSHKYISKCRLSKYMKYTLWGDSTCTKSCNEGWKNPAVTGSDICGDAVSVCKTEGRRVKASTWDNICVDAVNSYACLLLAFLHMGEPVENVKENAWFLFCFFLKMKKEIANWEKFQKRKLTINLGPLRFILVWNSSSSFIPNC